MDYKEKLRLAKEALDSGSYDKETIEYIFPELAEPEDERIRKELIAYCQVNMGHTWHDIKQDDYIAWLEKCGEQKSIDKIQLGKKYKCIASPRYSTFMRGEIYKPEDKFLCSLMNFCSDCFEPIEDSEQKPTNKIEPKFKVGNKIKLAKEPEYLAREIIAIQNDAYYFDERVYLPFSRQDEWELVEQKPAYTKEYDFHGIKFIPKFAKGDIIKDKKRGEVSTIKDFSYDTGLYTHTYGQFPITIQDNYEIIEPKQEWSEEDRETIDYLIDYLESELDSSYTDLDKETFTKEINLLKSLRPQTQWKPTDEQMEYLAKAITTLGDEGNCKTASILNNLRVELKKLKG